MKELKRRDFLRMIGGIAVSVPAILLKANPTQFIPPVNGLDIGLELPMGVFKITSREDAVRVAEKNLLFIRRVIKASDICVKTLSHYECSLHLYRDCYNYCSHNYCQKKKD